MKSFKNGVYKVKRECDKSLMTLKDLTWLQTEKTVSKVTFSKKFICGTNLCLHSKNE